MSRSRPRIYDHFAEWFTDRTGIALTPEHRFAPPRRWRFDFADLGSQVAIELEGGTWSGGRHTRGAGYAKDCEKYNIAASLGWRVFRFTPAMLVGAEAERWADVVVGSIRR